MNVPAFSDFIIATVLDDAYQLLRGVLPSSLTDCRNPTNCSILGESILDSARLIRLNSTLRGCLALLGSWMGMGRRGWDQRTATLITNS